MSSKKKVKYVETQDDLELIRLSRHKMEKFVHLPIFKKLALGCFVRIGIGQVGNSIAQTQISPGDFSGIFLQVDMCGAWGQILVDYQRIFPNG